MRADSTFRRGNRRMFRHVTSRCSTLQKLTVLISTVCDSGGAVCEVGICSQISRLYHPILSNSRVTGLKILNSNSSEALSLLLRDSMELRPINHDNNTRQCNAIFSYWVLYIVHGVAWILFTACSIYLCNVGCFHTKQVPQVNNRSHQSQYPFVILLLKRN
jgi:hypothetical protein